MNRTTARIAVTAGALLLSGAALAPSAAASAAYPPSTPPGTTTTIPGQPAPTTAPPAAPAAPAAPVSRPANTPGVDALAYTGVEVGGLLAGGLALVIAGGAMVRSTRRPSAAV